MSLKNILKLAKKKAGTLVLSGAFLAAASFLFLTVTQKNFQASADILVSQNQQGFSDYYALSQSANYLSSVLMQSIYSETFINATMANSQVNANFLPSSEPDRLKAWKKDVQVSENSNVGIISISVYGNNSQETTNVANAVIDVLVNKYSLFLGNGQNIDVRVLNSPIVENNPTLAQISLTVAGGFVFGVILAFMFFYYKEESRQEEERVFFTSQETVSVPAPEPKLNLNADYVSPDSNYWKKRLENN